MSSRPVMEAAVGAAVTAVGAVTTAAGAAVTTAVIAAAGAAVTTAAGATAAGAVGVGETTGSNVHFRHHRCSLSNDRPATPKDDGPIDLRIQTRPALAASTNAWNWSVGTPR
jgi:hypothetical protein